MKNILNKITEQEISVLIYNFLYKNENKLNEEVLSNKYLKKHKNGAEKYYYKKDMVITEFKNIIKEEKNKNKENKEMINELTLFSCFVKQYKYKVFYSAGCNGYNVYVNDYNEMKQEFNKIKEDLIKYVEKEIKIILIQKNKKIIKTLDFLINVDFSENYYVNTFLNNKIKNKICEQLVKKGIENNKELNEEIENGLVNYINYLVKQIKKFEIETRNLFKKQERIKENYLDFLKREFYRLELV